MELLTKARGLDRAAQEQAFMAGMLSMLGILFGMPLADVLSPLKLNEALTTAVLNRSGELGLLLQAVECGERSDEAGLTDLLGELNLTPDDYNENTLEAYQWMLGIIQERQDGTDA
jgi:c-di-GMP-related signal transduction protein